MALAQNTVEINPGLLARSSTGRRLIVEHFRTQHVHYPRREPGLPESDIDCAGVVGLQHQVALVTGIIFAPVLAVNVEAAPGRRPPDEDRRQLVVSEIRDVVRVVVAY